MIPYPRAARTDIKEGDLVRLRDGEYTSVSDPWKKGNATGLVLGFSIHHPDDSGIMIRVAEVLWDDGPAWVEITKLEVCKPDER